ncbi:uncharacterized protein LOC127465180 isoform X4 [Manacus candei]|uniref:uncharacterized protein LOC127465180 isoform X4 n=2 Tax=Manacus candei TaxID=415023 RepID=UPI002227D8FB|nr:uncharacterized protein LOC127465180 isoform X4 [Manacus candei]
MVGRAGLCIAPSGCVELQELLVPPGPMDWTPQPLRSCPATGAVSSGGTASPAGEVGRAFAGLVGHIYSSGMEPGKCTELSPGIERDQAREVKKEGRREVRQQASSTKLLCKQCPSVPAWLFVALQAEEPRPEMAECWCDPQWVSLPSGQSPELPLASPAEGWELPRASSIQLEDPGGCSSCCLGGENLEIGQEEEKPPDSSLSPRQPMNCLAGNGGTGWTLHCSLGMCGTAGTPGAAWADGLDAPAPPFLPSHWGRVQWWHCQPCSGMEPGKCTELSPGIERDQAREVKKEGRREVRQQASSTKLLCKQCPSVPAWLFVALQAEEPRPEMAECWCDPEWVSLPLGQSPELPLASPAEGWELPRASSIQLEDPGGCSSCCLGGENLEIGQEEEKPPDSSLSPRQPMNCLAGNGGTGWTLHCSLGMCGTAGTPGAAWADGLDAPAPPFLPSHWGRVQWWHCQPCSGMEPGKCTELSPGIERDQAREVKKEGRREVRQQASSTKLLCKQCPSVPAWLFVALQAEEPRPEMAECWCDPQWVSLPSGQSPELPLASPAEGWELPRASSIQLEDPGGCSSCCLGGENLEIGKEEEKPPDSSLSPRQPMNCLAGNGGTGWTLDCSLGMCGTAGTPGAAWADGLDAPAPPFLPSHWGRVQWWHCQPCSGMEPGNCTELSQGI